MILNYFVIINGLYSSWFIPSDKQTQRTSWLIIYIKTSLIATSLLHLMIHAEGQSHQLLCLLFIFVNNSVIFDAVIIVMNIGWLLNVMSHLKLFIVSFDNKFGVAFSRNWLHLFDVSCGWPINVECLLIVLSAIYLQILQ